MTDAPQGYVPAPSEEEELRLVAKEKLVVVPRETEVVIPKLNGKVRIRSIKPTEYALLLEKVGIKKIEDFTLGKLSILIQEVCKLGLVEPKIGRDEDLPSDVATEVSNKILEWSYLTVPKGTEKEAELNFTT